MFFYKLIQRFKAKKKYSKTWMRRDCLINNNYL